MKGRAPCSDDSPRTLGLWAGAAALAVVTGAIVAGDLAELHRRAGSLGPAQPVVVAQRALTLGSTVTPADVTTRRVHSSQLPPGVLHDTARRGRSGRPGAARARRVRGRRQPRAASGEPASPVSCRRAPEPYGSPSRTDLRPPVGSAVDVYASYASGSDALGTGRASASGASVVAAGAIVLATGDSVTLLVDEPQAASLADASARGTLFLALVPPEDARASPTGATRR